MKKYFLLFVFGLATTGVANADAIGIGEGITAGNDSTESAESEQTWWDMLVDWFIDDES